MEFEAESLHFSHPLIKTHCTVHIIVKHYVFVQQIMDRISSEYTHVNDVFILIVCCIVMVFVYTSGEAKHIVPAC